MTSTGPDDSFSLEPNELAALFTDTKVAWEALGRVDYGHKSSENVNTHEMALCSTVLADLGLRHVDDLAGATLDHDCKCEGSRLASKKVGRQRRTSS